MSLSKTSKSLKLKSMYGILSRYIASTFVLPFILGSLFFTVFMLTFELFRIAQLIFSKDISIVFIGSLMTDISLTFLPLTMPLAIFFAAIFAMNRISGDSEYIAMRAAGMSIKKILIPFMFMAAIVAFNALNLVQELVPKANREVKKKLHYLQSTGLLTGIKSGQFLTSIPNITFFSQYVSDDGSNLRKVFLHTYDEKHQTTKVILAEKGNFINKLDRITQTESLDLILVDGNISMYSKEGNKIERVDFKRYLFPVSEKSFYKKLATRENMMGFSELRNFKNKSLEEIIKLGHRKRDFFNAKFEFWNRLNTPLTCLVFTLLGFTLGVKNNRGKAKKQGFVAFVLLITYYFLYFSLVSIARNNNIPVQALIFIPSIVLTGFGIKFYRNLNWT